MRFRWNIFLGYVFSYFIRRRKVGIVVFLVELFFVGLYFL